MIQDKEKEGIKGKKDFAKDEDRVRQHDGKLIMRENNDSDLGRNIKKTSMRTSAIDPDNTAGCVCIPRFWGKR